jgi:hypothetical protein
MRVMQWLPLAALLSGATIATAQPATTVITTDVDHFWEAFDRIAATTDTATQRALLSTFFLDKASPGQRAMIAARRYTPDQYLHAIRSYPKFWRSIRANMMTAAQQAAAIDRGVEQLRKLYPALVPATVYFTVGAFRSPGTIAEGQVLIGSEFALGDSTVDTSEFPPAMENMAPYFAANPIRSLVQLAVHEYVHTQQRDDRYVLLNRSLYEGVAEYLSVLATGQPSSAPAIAYEPQHRVQIAERFTPQLLSRTAVDRWLYNDRSNEFGMRDLGYAVGYAIAQGVLARASDRSAAIAQLITLAPGDSASLDQLVDASGYFSRPMRELRARYEASRPRVIGISGLTNGDRQVSASVGQITVHFSTPMDSVGRGFDYGPLGEQAVLRIERVVGFAADRRSVTIGFCLQPGKRYQVMLSSRFRTPQGVELVPYLIDITTAPIDP